MYATYQQYLKTLHAKGTYRRLPTVCQGRKLGLLDFSTNDYLNLSHHPEVIKAGELATQRYGAGATGSRLLSGNLDFYEEFEQTIAEDKQAESSVLFSSGFLANLSTLSCLLDANVLKAQPVVFFDKLNHSSLYQAVSLTCSELCRYRHKDVEHLESLLVKYKNDTRPKFIVTETVFGMDGDIAPLAQIVGLAREHDAFLYLDEAHATGVFGKEGYGLSGGLNLQSLPHVVMGTLSKAVGASGGYVACHPVIRDFLVNKAPGFIYSTAPSPATVGAAFKAWQLIKGLNTLRDGLQTLGEALRRALVEAGMDVGSSQTHIVPVILGKEEDALAAQKLLLEAGIIVSCVRPPTVPPGTARLRIALTARHRLEDVHRLVEAVKKAVIP